ncbi:ABC transporter ATP-binding protein [Patescibacteria group bacterium]|nr:MAG: ABC transporter ATP-binding protein [Patescibacteria group bacterium]
MARIHSSRRVVEFLFGLRKVAPLLTFSMIFVQIAFAVLTTTIAPIFVSRLLTEVANGSATLQGSVGLLVGYAIILVFGDIVAIRLTIAMSYFAETKMQATVAARVLDHLTKKSMGYHANNMSGSMVSNSSKLNGSIERFWDTLVFTAIPITATVLSVCTALGFIFWQYGLVLAILSIIIISVIVKLQSSIAPISRDVAEKSSASTAYFADVVSNIAIVKSFSAEDTELKGYKNLIAILRVASMKEMKSVLLITGSFGAMMTVMNIAAFVAAIFATEHHLANIGVVYLVISYTLNVVAQLWSVGNITRSYVRIIGDAGPMISTLDEEIELKDIDNPQPLTITAGNVVFDNVTFTHEENDSALFRNFSIDIKAGERIGLVGRSGSGKTTLTRLLLRFSDVDSGEIRIDNQPIDKVAQADLRRHIAYVAQEPMLFHRSLRENIAYGRQGATDQEILAAAKSANALEFIEKLSKGLDTVVGERGVKLSGGQRQRVAIARAILKDAPILLLDEATSALDSESEKLIQDALKKLMTNRTSIVIAHRLSTIAKLDRIVVLDDGKIVEQGTHAELLAKKGTYAKLWAHQSGGFIEE